MAKSSFISKFNVLLGAGLTAASVVSCLPRGTDLGSVYGRTRLPIGARVDYAILRDSLLAPRCLNCHSEYNTEAGVLRDVTPGDPAHSPLYRVLVSGAMPPGGPAIPPDTVQIVSRYIEGLLPATPAPAPAPAPVPSNPAVDFNTLKTAILAPKCIRCHSEMETEDGLKPYFVAGKPEQSKLYESVANKSMPPRKPLEDSEVALIKSYIAGL